MILKYTDGADEKIVDFLANLNIQETLSEIKPHKRVKKKKS